LPAYLAGRADVNGRPREHLSSSPSRGRVASPAPGPIDVVKPLSAPWPGQAGFGEDESHGPPRPPPIRRGLRREGGQAGKKLWSAVHPVIDRQLSRRDALVPLLFFGAVPVLSVSDRLLRTRARASSEVDCDGETPGFCARATHGQSGSWASAL